MGAHARFIPPHRRDAIEAEIETLLQRVTLLIGRLDRADAPIEDLEEETDLSVDDGPCDISRAGLLPILPRYGVDQRRGPVNAAQGERAWHRMMTAR